MKSAYELAMERLEKSAPDRSTDGRAKGTDRGDRFDLQSAYRGEGAFFAGENPEARQSGNFEELEKLEKPARDRVRRLQEDCEEKKEKLRASFKA